MISPKNNRNRSIPQHIIIKLANFTTKEIILIIARERRFLTYGGRD